MKSRDMKKLMQSLPALVAAMLIAVLVLPSTVFAQDAATQAAQQAAQASQQAAQQAAEAAQRATDAAQQAAQQAMQDSMNAAQSAGAPTPAPRQRPTAPAPPQGPIPAQIAGAHNVFLTSRGAAPNSPVEMTTAYDQLSRDMAAWGHYTLVDTPTQADLIFELREIAPLTSVEGYHGETTSYSTPAFVLHIRDAKSNVVLWTVVSPIEDYGKRSQRGYWYSLAVSNLVSRVKVLTSTPLSPQETADLTAAPKTHYGRTAAILVGSFIVAGAVGGLLLHHAFENSLANQKQQQDNFCLAHGIPLSECAGG